VFAECSRAKDPVRIERFAFLAGPGAILPCFAYRGTLQVERLLHNMSAARVCSVPGVQLPELPLNLVLLVLEQFPASCQAKLVNKAAYSVFKGMKLVPAVCSDLPLWMLQQMFHSAAHSSSASSKDLAQKLMSCRAAAGELHVPFGTWKPSP
jgi:hypothetical protein